ncbi:hypothetical protein LZ32DRAFT_906 [Colletotrichum eremochloae]|nr:hypothetical protein LZ32DRAFT_906 [Colletotrichum eremochloae]
MAKSPNFSNNKAALTQHGRKHRLERAARKIWTDNRVTDQHACCNSRRLGLTRFYSACLRELLFSTPSFCFASPIVPLTRIPQPKQPRFMHMTFTIVAVQTPVMQSTTQSLPLFDHLRYGSVSTPELRSWYGALFKQRDIAMRRLDRRTRPIRQSRVDSRTTTWNAPLGSRLRALPGLRPIEP